MFAKLKTLFTGKDEKKLITAEEDFDELMDTINKDEVDLDKLERHVHKEFDEIGDNVKAISEKVDEVVGEKGSVKVK